MVDHPLKCSECQMTFKSPLLLSKHREKFCVGGALGDPHALRVRNDKRTDKHYTYDKVPITPEVKIVSPHYDYWRDAKIWNMAENHGKNMANLSAQNASLEKQKNDIRRRLMELSGAPPARPDPTSQLLDDIKETETKTQRTLEELKAQLKSLEDKGKKKSLPAPVVYNGGNSLVSEVRSLRQNYLHLGGNDPGILAQLSDMIAEAQALEDKQKNIKPTQKAKPVTVSPQAEALELENARIKRELLLLQEKRASQALYDQHSQKGDFERQLQRLEQDHSRKMGELQQEIERLKQQGELERYKRELAEEVARQNEAKSLPVQMVSPQGVPVSFLPAKPIAPYEIEPLGAAPYDPHNGFVIFYDFVRGLPVGCLSARLVVGLYDSQVRVGEAAILPPVNTESVRGQSNTYSSYGALIGAKQPVPRCQPQADLGIVVELQLTSPTPSVVDPHRLASHAWTKLSLFDEYGQLTTGRFTVPFRTLPISPLLPVRDLERLQRFGEACLFYRIIHARDALKESRSPVGFQFTPSYRHPPMEEYFESVVPPLLLRRSPDPPPPPSATPPPSTPGGLEPSPRKSPVRPATSERRIGFQVDRVKGAESGQAKVRLTAYHASTGKVVYSDTSPVTCSTTAVHSNFKHRSHVFGQQEAVFDGAELKGDVVVIVRFYLHKREYRMDGKDHHLFDADPSQEETLVAWAAMPLVAVSQSGSVTSRSRRSYDCGHMQVKTGTHTLRLYRPPVVDPSRVPTQPSQQPRDWVRYRAATVRFHVFQGSPRPGSLTPSEASDDEDSAPQSCWIPLERRVAPSEPYTSGDGFDIYVDGCRYLPDSVTFSRVALRVMDRRYRMYGPDVVTGVHLDSDIYNPVYEHKEEIRDPEVPPTATIIFKVYTIDKYYRELTCVGYSTLNVFVESGTERQPNADSGVQVSLNEGAHQLRLYQKGPDGADPLTERCLRESRTRYIPCASLLVRLVKAPRGNNGRPLEASRVDESDWLRLGVWQPRPPYNDGVYYSEKCHPTRGENEMFGSMVKRPLVTMRQIVSTVAQANDSFLSSDKNLAQYIRNQLTRVADSKPLDQDMTPICVYNPKHGLKIAVDGACNIPWVNFTQASVCLNPPGAFYMGSPHATYDKLRFTEHLDLSSSHTAPVWLDGFKHFPNRSHHKYLVWIIHLQEVAVTVDKQNYKYGLLDQAWTAVQVFSEEHAVSMLCQLPLIKGAPKPEMLSQLTREPCKAWLERGITNNTIQLLKGCSVFVRLCDARRDEELPEDVPEKGKLEVNLDYIPPQLESEYTLRREGKTLNKLVPPGKNLQDFASTLAVKFKSLVYKLYEEGNATS